MSPSVMHRALAAARPRALLATSTHDTKRSEDVRARIAVLSELPGRVGGAVARWRERAEPLLGRVAPDRVIEYAAVADARRRMAAAARAREAVRAEGDARGAAAHVVAAARRAYEAARDAWLDARLRRRASSSPTSRSFADEICAARRSQRARAAARQAHRAGRARLLSRHRAPRRQPRRSRQPPSRRSRSAPRHAPRARRRHASARRRRSRRAKLWTIRRVLGLRRKYPTRFDGCLQARSPRPARTPTACSRSRAANELVAVVPRLGVHADGWRDTTLELPAGTLARRPTRIDPSGNRPLVAGFARWRNSGVAFPIALFTPALVAILRAARRRTALRCVDSQTWRSRRFAGGFGPVREQPRSS